MSTFYLPDIQRSAINTAMNKEKDETLFGGSRSWKAEDWTASDDRSFLDCHGSTGRFHGNLDIKTLGGAGFASQRTTGEDKCWDLSGYAGIVLDIAEADDKRYTFILKDELLPRNPENGREQATISWEYDFQPDFGESGLEKGGLVFIPWSGLKPTYRGKEKEHTGPINLETIKRISVMMRSFFGDQEGPFSLTLRSISGTASSPVEASRTEQGYATSASSSTSRWTRYTQSFKTRRVCQGVVNSRSLHYRRGASADSLCSRPHYTTYMGAFREQPDYESKSLADEATKGRTER
ncbi:CIA30-domain-containing protein [Aureobasidium subglaciale]|nr:CIA30-domain-containing protein [Aureobasidium subglaciale]